MIKKRTIFTQEQAEAICGKLEKTSKMPCKSYSIPAKYCRKGSILRKVVGTICSQCYALKGRFVFGGVLRAMQRRYDSLDHPQWVEALSFLIKIDGNQHFRWHGSGDLQGIEHLENIVKVCEACTKVKFWLPTQEFGDIGQYLLKWGALPANLCVRFSSPRFGNFLPVSPARAMGVQVSGSDLTEDSGTPYYECPAPSQGGKCLTCRNCWKKEVFAISYVSH